MILLEKRLASRLAGPLAGLCLLLASLPGGAQTAPSAEDLPRLTIEIDPALGARWDAAADVAILADGPEAAELEAFLAVRGLDLVPLTRFPLERLAALEARAAKRLASLGKVPRAYALRSTFRVDAGIDETRYLEGLARELAALDAVVRSGVTSRRPAPPFDIAPPTPDLERDQTFRDRDPGVDIAAAWEVGARGQGVQVADVEYGWHTEHEEWNDRNFLLVSGLTPALGPDHDWTHHGTAVAGVLFAGDNGYGVTGLVPDLDAFLGASEDSQEMGFDRVGAIATAAEALDPGDVLVLEMQTDLWEPAEVDPEVWNVTRLATDLGLIVVAAAGNGDNDLDSSDYDNYHDLGDSGAILVGAGAPNREHARIFGSYGERIDVQAWGSRVLTTGATNKETQQLLVDGTAEQSYSVFDGTSAATPIVAGVVAALQSFAETQLGVTVDAETMRKILIDTGRLPPGGDQGIGPIPDTRAALARLRTLYQPGWAVAGFDSDLAAVSAGGAVQLYDATEAPENALQWVWDFPGGVPAQFWGQHPPPVTYAAAGTYDVTLSVQSAAGWDVETRTGVVRVGSPQAQTSGVGKLCGVELWDSGGTERMGIAEDVLLTLLPELPGQRVGLSFPQVELWESAICTNTYTRANVYHGTSITGVSAGYFCGNDSPAPIVSTDPSGALTLQASAKAFHDSHGFTARVDCLPEAACPSAALASDHGWISAVHVSGNFSHFTGPEPGGYTFYEEPIIEVPASDLADGWISILFETGYPGDTAYPFWWKVWIDYDHDGDFEEPEELFADTGFAWPYGSPWDWFLQVPFGVEGLYRMRVSMKERTPPEPCSSFEYGEVEDYWIHFPPRSRVPSGPGGTSPPDGG